MVVIDDHTLCAGKSLTVHRMAGPHMHTQVEFNLVLQGEITYRFNGGDLVIPEGQLVLFWGMVPHQVIAAPLGAKFICIYAPISLLLKLPHSSTMRAAIFGGAMAGDDLIDCGGGGIGGAEIGVGGEFAQGADEIHIRHGAAPCGRDG